MTNIHITRENLDLLQNLPADTTVLRCIGLGLTELPPNLPPGLQVLDCSDNQITNLPDLPPGLRILDCILNRLTYLPDLPSGLRILYCSGNHFTHLPNLPMNLRTLHCLGNQLTYLPDLPMKLTSLICNRSIDTLYRLQPYETISSIREKVNQWNAENMQQGYVLK